jgi:hypothetical protein
VSLFSTSVELSALVLLLSSDKDIRMTRMKKTVAVMAIVVAGTFGVAGAASASSHHRHHGSHDRGLVGDLLHTVGHLLRDL